MSAALKIEDLPSDNDPVARLRSLGRPDGFAVGDWPDYPALYGFDASHVQALIELAVDDALMKADETEGPWVWAPFLAWRVLGQLRAEAAIQPLLGLLREEDVDDWAADDLPTVFGMIGAPAIGPVAAFAREPSCPEIPASIATAMLAKIAAYHPDRRDECVAHLTRLLVPEFGANDHAATWAASSLLDLKAVEAIGAIRAAFARDAIDISIFGDLEDAEIALGLRAERTTPVPDYQSKLRALLSGRSVSPVQDRDGWLDGEEESDWTPTETVRLGPKIGRNEPCPCGSGKKYKKCCLE